MHQGDGRTRGGKPIGAAQQVPDPDPRALGLLLDECAEVQGDEERRADLIARARKQSEKALNLLVTKPRR